MSRFRRYGRPVPGDNALIPLAECGPIAVAGNADRDAWEALAETAILAHAATGAAFTTYDVARDHQLPDPPNHHHWGQLMHRLHDQGLIVPVDWTTSRRPTSNSSGVRVWLGSITKAA